MNNLIINERNGAIISLNATVATKYFDRMIGLLKKDKLKEGHALWIKPCNSIHTFGMKYPLDIIFLDKCNIVISLRINIKPNRFCVPRLLCHSAIELPAGSIERICLHLGDRFKMYNSQDYKKLLYEMIK